MFISVGIVKFSVPLLRIKNHHVAEKGQVFEEVWESFKSFDLSWEMLNRFSWVNHCKP
jgi:hypothetical protein